VGAFLLFFMAALAFEPLRQAIQESLGRRFIKGRAPASDLARELLVQEARADQSARLAELGAFASAVAHEVRNPLGVLQAHLVLLERGGAARETLDPMREQIERVSRFVDDLLRYGRPRPLELRMVDLAATADLALGAARQALGPAAPAVEILRDHAEGAPLVEADQEQMTQLCIVLFDNALRAIAGAETKRVRVSTAAAGARLRLVVEDSGPGIPKELLPRLFQPFVTGRKRDSTRAGTGLGLAIARGIVERHGGEIRAGASPTPGLGGARFEIELPRSQPLLAAASSSAPGSAPREEASP
jgi:signal transduction histidine kinase